MRKQKKRPEDLPRRTLHLDARVTQEEYDQVKQRAEECGMTVSKYARKCTLGHQPKYHLTEQEIEAYNQIGDARGDIVQFFNMFSSIEAEERQPLFSSAIFIRTWIKELTKLATELQNILNKRKELAMIAKAKVISHGSTAVNYSTKKKLVDVIQFHHLPEGISASAVWSRMMTLQEKFRGKLDQHRSLELTSIRIEVSPAREESVGWTLNDWRKLADDFVRTFDAIDLSEKAKRKSAKSTNLRNSQYVASLHRDSKSGILHLHINANRIDMEGNVNDAHFLFERARMAANAVTKERGWVQAETKRLQNIKKYGDDCIAALKGMKSFSWEEYERLLKEKGYSLVFKRDSDDKVRGYTVGRGKVLYKSSDLGHNRGLTPSRIVDTWKQLHQSEIQQKPVSKPAAHAPATTTGILVNRPAPQPVKPEPKKIHLEIPVDRKVCPVDIPEEIYRIIMDEAKAPDPADSLWTELKDVQHTDLLLFAGMVNEATTIAQNCGGGGNSATDD